MRVYLLLAMKKSHLLFFAIPAILVLSVALKQEQSPQEKYAQSITSGDLRTHLSILASDEYEGRETGERGQKMAADYISNFYKSIGAAAQSDGTWFQYVNLIKISGGTSTFSVGPSIDPSATFEAKKDYYYTSATPSVEISANEMLFAGYGIDDPKYTDYNQHDSIYKDKVLIILEGEPINNANYRITGTTQSGMWTKQRRAKLNAAKARNVKALIIVPADYAKSKESAQHSIEGYSLLLDEPQVDAEKQTPVIFLNASAANTILSMGGAKKTIEELRSEINATGKSSNLKAKTECSIKINRQEDRLKTENVLGYVEGSDLKEELIVVTAHYDHLGKHDGVVYNGADDDGSGTVAVMEMAEAFMKAKKDGSGPRRSMLFMAVSGEEKGLLGSAWYTNHPVYPLDKTVCDLNIDMIGRVDEAHSNDSNFVYVIGSAMISKELKKITEAANKKYSKLKLDYRFDDKNDPNMFYYRSDHYNFAKKGIPVAFFFNGVHADYHKETDEVSKINFSLMEKRTRLVFHIAWELANRDKRLKLNKKK